MIWLDSITDSMDVNLSKFWEIVKDRGAWHAIAHGLANRLMWFSNGKTQLKSQSSFPPYPTKVCFSFIIYWRHPFPYWIDLTLYTYRSIPDSLFFFSYQITAGLIVALKGTVTPSCNPRTCKSDLIWINDLCTCNCGFCDEINLDLG